MNPAALRVNLAAVRDGGIVIVNEDAFGPVDLKKAGYTDNPLDDPALSSRYRLIKVPISKLNKAATSDAGLTVKEAERCKNMFALGLVYWLYGRGLETTLKYLHKKLPKSRIFCKPMKPQSKAVTHTAKRWNFFTSNIRFPKPNWRREPIVKSPAMTPLPWVS